MKYICPMCYICLDGYKNEDDWLSQGFGCPITYRRHYNTNMYGLARINNHAWYFFFLGENEGEMPN
jgi:hypothetical protein